MSAARASRESGGGRPDARTGLLLAAVDEAFESHGWHGPTLLNTLQDVGVDAALWRPAPERHNIWEIALHTAYWKYIARRRLIGGGKRGGFPRKGSNYPAPPDPPDEAGWAADRALLREEHERFRAAVRSFPADRLDRLIGAGRATAAAHIYGVAAHDAYHAGQIRLIHRMFEQRKETAGRRRRPGR